MVQHWHAGAQRMPGKNNRKEVWQWTRVKGEMEGQGQAERASGEAERARAVGCWVTQT